jgi:hypothetical protein
MVFREGAASAPAPEQAPEENTNNVYKFEPQTKEEEPQPGTPAFTTMLLKKMGVFTADQGQDKLDQLRKDIQQVNNGELKDRMQNEINMLASLVKYKRADEEKEKRDAAKAA